MIKTVILVLALFAFVFVNYAKSNTTDSTTPGAKDILCKKWELKELKENGKTQDLPDFQIFFSEDGTYSLIEEDDTDNGVWAFSEDNSKVIFDKDTPDQDEWTIVTLEKEKLNFKLTEEGKKYEYIFIPYKESIQK